MGSIAPYLIAGIVTDRYTGQSDININSNGIFTHNLTGNTTNITDDVRGLTLLNLLRGISNYAVQRKEVSSDRYRFYCRSKFIRHVVINTILQMLPKLSIDIAYTLPMDIYDLVVTRDPISLNDTRAGNIKSTSINRYSSGHDQTYREYISGLYSHPTLPYGKVLQSIIHSFSTDSISEISTVTDLTLLNYDTSGPITYNSEDIDLEITSEIVTLEFYCLEEGLLNKYNVVITPILNSVSYLNGVGTFVIGIGVSETFEQQEEILTIGTYPATKMSSPLAAKTLYRRSFLSRILKGSK